MCTVMNTAVGGVPEALRAEFPPFLSAKTSVSLGLIEEEETSVHIPVSFISCL